MLGFDAVRLPEVSGLFYPAEKLACLMALETATNIVPRLDCLRPKVVVAPHAGWNYCLPVVAEAFVPLKSHADSISRVVLIGPAHRHPFSGIATTASARWQTPIGAIETNDPTLQLLAVGGRVRADDAVFAGEHALEVLAPMVKHILPQARLVPLLVGNASDDAVIDVLRALWGGNETLIVVSSDLTHFLTEQEATATDTKTRSAIEALKPQLISATEACGHRPLRAMLHLAQLHDLRFTSLDHKTSAAFNGDMSRVVGYGAFVGEYAQSAAVSQTSRTVLTAVARDVLASAVRHDGRMPGLKLNGAIPADLSATRATFVTLKLDGALRGCIGSLEPHRSLIEDVANNVVKAAFNDPRFKPLTEEELQRVDIEISILSHPRALHFSSEADLIRQFRPDIDGLILTDNGKSGLFLPSVWESLPVAGDFWRGLKRKAGLPEDHFSDTMTIRRFTVETIMKPASVAHSEEAVKAA